MICSGTKEMSDPDKVKDLHWERVKTILITRAGCIVEDLKEDIFSRKKQKNKTKTKDILKSIDGFLAGSEMLNYELRNKFREMFNNVPINDH